MRKLVVLFVFVASAGQAQRPDTLAASMVTELVLAPTLLQSLGALADASKTEAIRCGLGVSGRVRVLVDLLYAPAVIEATDSSVTFRRCPLSSVMEWHSHPPTPGASLSSHCFLSTDDQLHAMRNDRTAMFYMVHVTNGVYCWWSLSQIVEYVQHNGFGRPMAPIRGQTSW